MLSQDKHEYEGKTYYSEHPLGAIPFEILRGGAEWKLFSLLLPIFSGTQIPRGSLLPHFYKNMGGGIKK